MIKIQRSIPAPEALQAGEALVLAMHQAVRDRPVVAGTSAEKFEFDSKIYGAEEVKTALIAMQHEKCAYCEGTFLAFSYGDIEHYRPKGYSQQAKGTRTIRPGYYWLAYDWLNLLFSCERCNRQRKRNLFPLLDPAARARTPDGVAAEHPLLLDPAGDEDPRDHIRFEGNVPTARTDVGAMTIQCLDLDRVELSGERLEWLKKASSLQKLVRAGQRRGADAETQADGEDAAAELEIMAQSNKRFSAMVLDLLGR